jgi:serine/threonine protein kinase
MADEWGVLLGLFEGALERPERERAAFLAEQTKNDPALRRDIESLLAAHENVGQFLSAPVAGPPAAGCEFSPPPHRPAAGHTRLATGTSLGVFTIVERLGAGGMGEVYRARDTRLDREVAIKVLSPERDTAPGARERFEREGRAISRLSHPRICTIHDVGVAALEGADIVPYLVMELLDGETLGARLVRAPPSIAQAMAYAIDIADALIAAHGQGIVHRDLKPGNVMVTSTGVKLLDFGLAQLRVPEPAGVQSGSVSSVPGSTSAGLVMGTLPYTSPEQLRGEKVDARTDIFAFGALLHEMLTGTRPFTADSQAGLIAAVLEHDAPPVSERQPLAPASLDRLVRKCLAKNPDDRWQTARDLKSELVWVADRREVPRGARPPSVVPRRWASPQLIAVGIPTIVALTLAVALWRPSTVPTPQRAVTRLSLNLPPGVTLSIPINGTSLAIAPDGSRIAFIGVRQGTTSLFIHTLATGTTMAIPETRDAVIPMFSADSRWVAFGAVGAIKKVPAGGGPVQVMKAGGGGPMTWLSDGRVVRGSASGLGIDQHLPEQRSLTTLAEGEEGHLTPLALPDGSLLFTGLRGGMLSALNSVNVWRPGATEAQQVIPHASSPQLLGRDGIIFAQGRALYAAGFDSRTIRLTGEPRATGIEVQTTSLSAAPMYAVATNGTLVYAEPPGGRRLVWVDRDGREEFVKTRERMYTQMRLSPDGTRVVVGALDDDRDLWVIALDGSFEQKLTSGPARDAMPVWSLNGHEIFFTTAERNINRISSDASAPARTFFRLPKPDRLFPLSMSADGNSLLVQWDILPRRQDLRLLELGRNPQLKPLLGSSGTEGNGQLSPNGRWLVYQSSETTGGRDGQIVVRPFPDTHARQWVVSPGVGRQPIWSHDGREIFYLNEDGAVMSVRFRPMEGPHDTREPPVRVVTPVNAISAWANGPTFGVSPDGRRFLFIKAPELDIRSLNVILNWDVEVHSALAGAAVTTP